MRRSARLCMSCCASVLATTNSTPCRFAAIMLSTALVPPPPTPITVMRGLKSVCCVCGMVRFRVIATSPPVELPIEPSRCCRCYATTFDSRRAAGAAWQKIRTSHALPQKVDDATHPSRGAFNLEIDIAHRASFTCAPGQQTGGRGECRTARRVGQTAQCSRATETHLFVEDAACQIARAGKLTGTAGQHHARTRGARQTRPVEA